MVRHALFFRIHRVHFYEVRFPFILEEPYIHMPEIIIVSLVDIRFVIGSP